MGWHIYQYPRHPKPCPPPSPTDPEVPGLKISVCHPVTSLQAAEVESQDVLNLLRSDLGQHCPFLLRGREQVSPKHVAQMRARQWRDALGSLQMQLAFFSFKGMPRAFQGLTWHFILAP